ncbi:hypothetical protein Tdes44962_MAKER07132 [Teratosphaeria destructans]|uniref:Uncharacterized protein n=1 Tax=Teratosphaeria destructans TaxID=418781 RepID=A0A9W7SZJ9_9PEZI|nr:hypothetical protein Tdes44962_MAKER07132 [Teratosphaeria destructans]
MSLAILPSSPVTYGGSCAPALLPSRSASSKRPKLSLNTTNTSLPATIGKGSTSLRLETLSATSPTSRNTFSNGYYAAQLLGRPTRRPQRPSLAPLATEVPSTTSNNPLPIDCELLSSAESGDLTSASAVSSTSTSTNFSDLLSTSVPYKLADDITSILCNGPIIEPRSRSSSTSRPMSSSKKVVFKAPLTEEIKTTKYTMAHSDISSSTISTLELPPPAHTHQSHQSEGMAHREAQQSNTSTDQEWVEATAPHTGEKRESSDEEDHEVCPATPVAGRRKRHRQWRWTLGPIGQPERASQDAQSDLEHDEKQS